VARRRKKRGGSRKKGIRIGATVGIITGLYMLYRDVSEHKSNAGAWAIQSLTGFDIASGKWNWRKAHATLPIIAGVGLSMVASKVGLNRYTPKGINI